MRLRLLQTIITGLLLVASLTVVSSEKVSAIGTVADAVLGQSGSFTTNSAGTSATGLNGPAGSAVDAVHHRLFVGDTKNNRVLVYPLDSTNTPVSDTASYVLGQNSMTTGTASLTRAGLNGANSVAYDDANNHIYVADQDAHRVLVYDVSTISNGMNASYVLGQADFTSKLTTVDASTMQYPQYVALDTINKRAFVSDASHHRILVYDISSLANGKAATWVIGQPNFTTATATTTASGLSGPGGVSFDQSTNFLWVSDSNNNRVLGYDMTSLANGMAATFVLGQTNFTSGSSSLSRNRLNRPGALSAHGRTLFVSDVYNSRVLRWDLNSITNGMDASAVIGQSDFTTGTAAVANNRFNNPWGLYYDPTQGKLYVGDYGNNRVLMFGVANASDVSLSANIEPILNFAIDGHSGSCNGASQTPEAVVSGTAISFGNLSTSSNQIAAQALTVGTNAANGYTAYVRSSGVLSDGRGNSIANISGATNAAPAAFSSPGTPAFGYTTDDSTLGIGIANRFTNAGPKWAALATSNAEVSHDSGAIRDNAFCVAYQVGIGAATPAGTYSTAVLYTVVPNY